MEDAELKPLLFSSLPPKFFTGNIVLRRQCNERESTKTLAYTFKKVHVMKDNRRLRNWSKLAKKKMEET
jgi:hypothetical protein